MSHVAVMTGLMSQDSALMGLYVSVIALSFTFVLSARLREHRTLFDGLAGSTDAANYYPDEHLASGRSWIRQIHEFERFAR